MFVEKIKSDGLAQLSYLVGDGGECCVIDPRRDVDVYIELARELGCRITRVFETHRNEDLVSGAPILKQLTGAKVFHGPNPAGDVVYAETAKEGDTFRFGKLALRALETPGHTDDSLSFALYDTDSGDEPVAVFTGDALFIGDVGRTDFYPERAREVAGLLYDSLQKLLRLGDQAIVYPAHGAGSVCGSLMADREFSTIGHERRNNPRLKLENREQFIDVKVDEHHELPPYFKRMEELNLSGAGALNPGVPGALSAAVFESRLADATVLDVRSTSSFLGAHVPGSLSMPLEMIPVYTGWLVDYDADLLLVADDARQAEAATLHLARIGYDHVAGFLAESLAGWAAGAKSFESTPVVSVETVAERVMDPPEDWTLLDVRKLDEIREGRVKDSRHVFLGELPNALGDLNREHAFTVMCGSGVRATVAASLMKRAGFNHVDVFLGSIGAWQTAGLDTF